MQWPVWLMVAVGCVLLGVIAVGRHVDDLERRVRMLERRHG
jgi:hypothetical protein